MAEDPAFLDLIRRVRAGDPQACAELVRDYERFVRRVVRLRLPANLAAVCSHSDVCQTVLGCFFVRARLGEYELTTPQQLVQLLSGMARNKALKALRREHADCRDARRRAARPVEEHGVADAGQTPSELVAHDELVRKAEEMLPEPERQVVELLRQGLKWPQIAARLGGGAEAVRKRHERARADVLRRLGLEWE
jgi:RNA polymerase sigma-70 factor (ECF subfamily)